MGKSVYVEPVNGVVGIVGDADIYCLACARRHYGKAAVARVLSGDGAPSEYDYGASTAPDWPQDNEGNYLTGYTAIEWIRQQELPDGYTGCGSCLRRIVLRLTAASFR